MEHFAPHNSSVFEGYYSKFTLPSGASLALIICSVPKATKRPHMVSFTYVPKDVSKIFQRELWVENIERVPTGPDNAFELRVPGLGYMKCAPDSTTEYKLDHEDFSLEGITTNRIPWSETRDTPEGNLVYLPIPLHWHVQSPGSECKLSLKIPSADVPAADAEGKAMVHQEKNWAQSFPSAHIWIQAREGARGFCLAGGQILGMEAYLLAYRSEKWNVDFRPPFALKALGISPFMSVMPNWDNRSFELSVQSFRTKIVARAKAPAGTFFSLSSPFPEGHRENYLGQSFQATLDVEVYESGWFGPWNLVHKDRFEGAALEFGGEYYPQRGTDKKMN
ncbi:hypothetical protein H2201_001325 [Coniosporium apollinis]|uniref:Uncharacterized protein n=1 Tax=Coniosporium apollinis TaxID=61459 RepID=A0ABQ9P2T1_9PEZI|nr:hypothetical protein H2201_001325 [Coniosporium apollinis]